MSQVKLARVWAWCVLIGCTYFAVSASAATLAVHSLPAGYTTSSLSIGQPYGGALAVDPVVQTRIYVAVGFFGNESIVKVDSTLGTTTTVAVGIGDIGGMTVMSNGDLALTENGTSQTILRAHDSDADGDFLDAGEVTQLIAPILADSGFGFTGTEITVASAGNASAIPAGSLVIQTADGGTSGDILVVLNPTTAPSFRPAGDSYFTGFGYNGGIAFDPAGNLIMGESAYPNGRIYGLVNTNADDHISSGESHILVETAAIPNGIADLAVSQDGRVFYGGNQTSFGSADAKVFAFQLPANLLTGTGSPSPFATTNAAYISTLRFDDATKTFTAGANSNTARLIVCGLDSAFNGFSNLVLIKPNALSGVADWRDY